MNWLDLFGDNNGPVEVQFSPEPYVEPGVCEDDPEFTTMLMQFCPDESSHQHGSPLRFANPPPPTDDSPKQEQILKYQQHWSKRLPRRKHH